MKTSCTVGRASAPRKQAGQSGSGPAMFPAYPAVRRKSDLSLLPSGAPTSHYRIYLRGLPKLPLDIRTIWQGATPRRDLVAAGQDGGDASERRSPEGRLPADVDFEVACPNYRRRMHGSWSGLRYEPVYDTPACSRFADVRERTAPSPLPPACWRRLFDTSASRKPWATAARSMSGQSGERASQARRRPASSPAGDQETEGIATGRPPTFARALAAPARSAGAGC